MYYIRLYFLIDNIWKVNDNFHMKITICWQRVTVFTDACTLNVRRGLNKYMPIYSYTINICKVLA